MSERPIDRALAWARDLGMNQSAFAREIGVTPQDVTNWKRRGMPPEHHAAAARITKHSVDELLGLTSSSARPAQSNIALSSIGTRRIPLLSYVQAGQMAEALEFGGDCEYLLADLELGPSAFALQIRGDSMLPEFREGDRVIIDPAVAPLPGDFVVAKNGSHEATFKKYRPRGLNERGETVFELVPLNEDYESMRSDITPIVIIGTMVEHRKYRRR